MPRDLVVLSGGMDSATVLALAVHDTAGPVAALGFDYGQRHRRELDAAQAVADQYGVPYEVRHLTGLLSGSSLLGDGPIPHGDYGADNMASTVVNGRNLLFASAVIAACQPGDRAWFGVHGGDHHLYPDCRPQFWHRLAALSDEAYGVQLRTPFLDDTKAGIALTGARLGVPFHLTWSCYEGGQLHCGRCGTCRERQQAFIEAGLDDPTEYRP